jgi:hypothetical protein
MKTFYFRITDEMFAQFEMIAKFEKLLPTDALRQVMDQWICERQNNPEFQEYAAEVTAYLNEYKGVTA